ncbi:atrial natriuretic peptide receptor 1-like [Paramacrobiotus metropolitanus]|uniref:atrial natriuretic peptide receptor 1-like n=1 Tax=Paramacrobiotus metropolitanus TaxID=2943436 RepID=UPI002445AF83|nr:atrial natriuretic peptide receptor 1-like [Paramacrobiotus metropolitanus]
MVQLGPLPGGAMVSALTAVLFKYGWTKNLGFWCPSNGMSWPFLFCNLFMQFGFYNQIDVQQVYKPDSEMKEFNTDVYRKVLQDLRNHTRIIIVYLNPPLLRDFMITAHDMNMTNGDFVFLTLALQPTPDSPYMFEWKTGDASDAKAAQAYQSLIASADTLFDWDEMETFINKTAIRSAEVYNATIPPSHRKNEATALVFDLLFSFAECVNRSLSEPHGKITARQVTQALRHQMYSRQSSSTLVSSTGTANFLLPLLKLNPKTGKFETAATFETETKTFTIMNPDLWKWHNFTDFPSNHPTCGFTGTDCPNMLGELQIYVPLAGVLVCVLTITAAILQVQKKKHQKQELQDMLLDHTGTALSPMTSTISEQKSFAAILTYTGPGLNLENQMVMITPLPEKLPIKSLLSNRPFQRTALTIRHLNHVNVGKFYGVIIDNPVASLGLCAEFSQRGSLLDAIGYENISTDLAIRMSFLYDLIKGLLFIHSSPLEFHGNLSITGCFIDSRFTLKVSQAGYSTLFNAVMPNKSNDRKGHMPVTIHRANDMLQFGTICTTVLKLLTIKDGMGNSKNNLVTDIQNCLRPEPNLRPSAFRMRKTFQAMRTVPDNVVSHMLKLLDRQTYQLEEAVQQKTESLLDEMHKTDTLLAEMLPRSIIVQLRNKESIPAESFDSVTLLFSDIPAFVEILARNTPMDIVNLLNATHSAFDEIVPFYDAYKVETINDSYMIASGVPIRNGGRHASELCSLAKALLKASNTLSAGVSQTVFAFRIGINSGPVVAGVIGTKAPRYCLFGDTVNTASRMESSGEAGKIHISASTEELARKTPGFRFAPRGEIDIKGKGKMHTFWLM